MGYEILDENISKLGRTLDSVDDQEHLPSNRYARSCFKMKQMHRLERCTFAQSEGATKTETFDLFFQAVGAEMRQQEHALQQAL